ncbi:MULTISPECIES: SDR family NAD(P)-dependent oxidoreductase [Rhodomicrobium]|uniref:SDR family NAD(P)-dependent oxidoreductase n=1 Tax=Rhodomicrobium TaxID=1068 RepID=UPI000B4B2FC3|nr:MULTISPECIES: SDR family NAD(P)-dependent oxidoreductase [Rhodomicrobium]
MPRDRYARYPSLQHRPVLITGGATGIGASLVRAFADQGAKVGFLDLEAEAGQALAEELTAQGQRVLFERCDVTDIPALRKAIADLEARNGPTLVLANNVANDTRHKWEDVTPDYWDQRVAVNLRPHFFAIQAVAPGMIAAKQGSIVNFGSVSWRLKQGGMPGYTASKAAIYGLTRGFATDLGKHGIRVNTLEPGWVMTERQLKLWVTPQAEAEIEAGQALSGRVQPDDLARACLFLASDDSKMISATVLTVDGGWT